MTGKRQPLIAVGQIADMLSARIVALCEQLLPNGRREGHEYFVGSVAGEPGKSMAVNLQGKPGVWCDFASQETGDALDLVGAVLFAGNKADAVAWSKSWLGLDGHDPSRLAVTRKALADRRDDPDPDIEDAKKRDGAFRLFRGGKACNFQGSLADRYLRGRGIDLEQLGQVPGCLAFAEHVWCAEVRANLPAMLASIQIAGKFVGVHRTWLDASTGGKAWVTMPKKTLGRYRGGVIPLWRPPGAPKWAQLFETGESEPLVVTEGIENGLSVAMAQPGVRVVAAVALKNIGAMQLPPGITEFTIAADNDQGWREQAALRAAIAVHQRAGRIVRIARAPEPHKDFNDWLQALLVVSPPSASATGGPS